MAGLTSGGFTKETYADIKDRIEGKLEVFNAGFDFSPESPDGQLIGIMTYEIYQAWQELANVYDSYNPQVAFGAGLRNIGLITGLPYGFAEKSQATVETTGVDGTIIPQNSVVTDDAGNEFYVAFETALPNNLQVIAIVAGAIPITAGTITTIQTPVTGWSTVAQATDGVIGSPAQTEQQYKTTRQRTVMRNYTSVVENMQAQLVELGLGQAVVINNTTSSALGDGTPANSIHVTVGEVGATSDEDIAAIILATNALGCGTYGSTSVVIEDSQGVSQTISFSKATAVEAEIAITVTYHAPNTAGADENIIQSLREHINGLLSGDDVIWSRLFAYVTPYAEAEITSLTLGLKGGSLSAANLAISDSQFASITDADITLTVV